MDHAVWTRHSQRESSYVLLCCCCAVAVLLLPACFVSVSHGSVDLLCLRAQRRPTVVLKRVTSTSHPAQTVRGCWLAVLLARTRTSSHLHRRPPATSSRHRQRRHPTTTTHRQRRHPTITTHQTRHSWPRSTFHPLLGNPTWSSVATLPAPLPASSSFCVVWGAMTPGTARVGAAVVSGFVCLPVVVDVWLCDCFRLEHAIMCGNAT